MFCRWLLLHLSRLSVDVRSVTGYWGRLWFSCGIRPCGKGLVSASQYIFTSAGKVFISPGH